MTGFETIEVGAQGATGHITLNRPERLNALSRLTLQELARAARWFDEQRAVKVVVVSGRGRSFSAGFDLNDFAHPDPDYSQRDVADIGRLMAEAITDMNALTIAAVHRHCVGGGLVLAASCDLRVAADSAVFSIPEVDLGIPLAWGGIPRLVREIGPAATKELVLTCRRFGPDEAKSLGFLNSVVPAAELEGTVAELAASLAAHHEATGQRRDRGDGRHRAQRRRRRLLGVRHPRSREPRGERCVPRVEEQVVTVRA